MKNRNAAVSMLALVIFIFGISPAAAYVDPGSGTAILTAVFGAVAAIGYTARKYFYRVMAIFKKDKNKSEDKKSS